MTNRLFKDIFRYLPTGIVPALMGFISIPVLTHLFEPGDYGRYSLVQATVYIALVLNSWVAVAAVRFFVSYEKKGALKVITTNLIKLLICSTMVLSTVWLLLLHVTASRWDISTRGMFYAGLGVVVSSSFFQLFQNLFKAERRITAYNGFAVWSSVMSIVFGLLCVLWLKTGICGMLWGTILAGAIALPVLVYLQRSRISMRIPFSRQCVRGVAVYSFPLVVAQLDAWVLSLSDRFLIQVYCSERELGIYSVSYNLADKLITVIITIFMTALPAVVMRAWENEGADAASDSLEEATRLFLIMGVPAVVGLSLVSKALLEIMTQNAYYGGYTIIPWVAAGALLLGLEHIYQAPFWFHKKNMTVMISFLMASVLNIILNVLLIPRFGSQIAAVTTCISYGALFLLIRAASRSLLVFGFPYATCIKVVVSSCVMGCFVTVLLRVVPGWLSVRLGVAVVCSGVAYVGMLVLLRESEVIKMLRGVVGKGKGWFAE